MAVPIGDGNGAPNFAKRRFVLEPDGRIPAHRHPDIEHEQYIVRGEMVLGLDDETEWLARSLRKAPSSSASWEGNRGRDPRSRI